MENRFILFVACVSAVYYGFQTARILPWSFRLIGALRQRRLVWPGPPTEDPDPTVRRGRVILGSPTEYLFPSYFKHALGVFAAFSMSVMLVLNYYTFWIVAAGMEWIAFGLPMVAVILGGRLYLRRARYNQQKIRQLLQT